MTWSLNLNSAAVLAIMFVLHIIGEFITICSWSIRQRYTQSVADYSPEPQPWRVRARFSAFIRTVHVFVYSLPFLLLGRLTLSQEHWHGWPIYVWFWVSIAIPHWILDIRPWSRIFYWSQSPLMAEHALYGVCLATSFCLFYGAL